MITLCAIIQYLYEKGENDVANKSKAEKTEATPRKVNTGIKYH